MLNVIPSGDILGARIEGLDLSKPVSAEDHRVVVQALGENGMICIPDQHISAGELKAFAQRFGTLEINVANSFMDEDHPEVMILSNIKKDGKPIGLSDAGQDWHTDMSYSKDIAFANVLYGLEIPTRDGEPLGCTEFANMHQAYDDLPEELKTKLAGRTATHDFNKFWEKMRSEKGSSRPALTPEQRAKKPPVLQPVFLTHPITGRTVLYANPGYTMQIDGMDTQESDEILAFLFKHQLQEKYRIKHMWKKFDVIMWDNIGTLHNAVADYGPDEHRLIKRCQVMADKVLDGAALQLA
ncbi:alpha-ketoglutarate-dependent taurine dioxygenase TauD (plasmid) [Octadecabacter arcticus 238]|jgi:taurine dioxygenase|uniref:Alpha-ketoglutarate-dependent taurine dioxygenase TauD n=1 Tax=Octadecabacter arcticus 238 TaxID=391616 RepID=M9RQC1_9RHOB|nr:TauD/TfdA family dioxygenase [Octadecabacter arcticus]AGI74834.1 alpha-ketoglutarate-dependent taurine dioxygenase TauD [Octadecabacter arcticus 238]